MAALDEPTAGLDGATERTVVYAISELAVERTVVLVAHRPALAAMADRTVVVTPPAVTAPMSSASEIALAGRAGTSAADGGWSPQCCSARPRQPPASP